MLGMFDSLYIFVIESPMRTVVTKLEKGQKKQSYVLLGDGCTCLGMQKTRNCKHQKMNKGEIVGDAVATPYALDFVERLMTSLGQEYIRPDMAGMPPTMDKISIVLKKVKGFSKAVGFVQLGGKNLVVMIEVLK